MLWRLWRKGLGEVAKRSNAADCKSVAPAASKVRILPSPPASVQRGHRPRNGTAATQRNDGLCSGRPVVFEGRSRSGGGRERTGRIRIEESGGPGRRCGSRRIRVSREGGSNSVVESQPSKLLVAGSIPVSRSTFPLAELPSSWSRSPGGRWHGKVRAADLPVDAATRRGRCSSVGRARPW